MRYRMGPKTLANLIGRLQKQSVGISDQSALDLELDLQELREAYGIACQALSDIAEMRYPQTDPERTYFQRTFVAAQDAVYAWPNREGWLCNRAIEGLESVLAVGKMTEENI